MRFVRTWVRRDNRGYMIDLNSSRNLVREVSLSVELDWLLGGNP
jgi:hypothetical protein